MIRKFRSFKTGQPAAIRHSARRLINIFVVTAGTLILIACSPHPREAGNDLLAEFETTRGTFLIQLFEHEAPIAVAHFTAVIENTHQPDGAKREFPFFTDIPFDLVNATRIEAGNAPLQKVRGVEKIDLPDEISSRHSFKSSGMVALTGEGRPDSGGTRFFINLTRMRHLDDKSTIIGKVIEGMDLIRSITKEDRILSAGIIRGKPYREYQPDTDSIKLSIQKKKFLLLQDFRKSVALHFPGSDEISEGLFRIYNQTTFSRPEPAETRSGFHYIIRTWSPDTPPGSGRLIENSFKNGTSRPPVPESLRIASFITAARQLQPGESGHFLIHYPMAFGSRGLLGVPGKSDIELRLFYFSPSEATN